MVAEDAMRKKKRDLEEAAARKRKQEHKKHVKLLFKDSKEYPIHQVRPHLTQLLFADMRRMKLFIGANPYLPCLSLRTVHNLLS